LAEWRNTRPEQPNTQEFQLALCNAPLYLTPSSPEILKLSSVDAENNLAEAQLPAVIPSRGFGSELRPSENKCDARPAVFAGRSDLFPQLGYIQLGYTS